MVSTPQAMGPQCPPAPATSALVPLWDQYQSLWQIQEFLQGGAVGWQGERGKNGRGWTQRRKNHNQSWEIMREIYWSLPLFQLIFGLWPQFLTLSSYILWNFLRDRRVFRPNEATLGGLLGVTWSPGRPVMIRSLELSASLPAFSREGL